MRVYLYVMAFCGVLLLTTGLAQAADNVDLTGSRWQLVSIDDQPVIAGSTISLEFLADSRVGGSAGCNSYGGSVTVHDDGRLTISEVFSTMMACLDERVMQQEVNYLTAMQAAATYEVRDELLIITTSSQQQLSFMAIPRLPETTWRLVAQAENAVVGSSELTLTFGNDGSITGSGGCNSFGGSFRSEGVSLSIDSLTSTERACLDLELMAQETRYFAALTTASRINLTRDTLIVFYGDTGAALTFERVYMLANTSWQLEPQGEVVPDAPITLQFDDQGRAAGSGGCNQYSSSYTQSGSSIRFAAVVSTRMACEERIMQAESAYFVALEAVERFTQTSERLTLITTDGQTLTFIPGTIISRSA